LVKGGWLIALEMALIMFIAYVVAVYGFAIAGVTLLVITIYLGQALALPIGSGSTSSRNCAHPACNSSGDDNGNLNSLPMVSLDASLPPTHGWYGSQ
jgi:hypothetical protein